MPTAIPCPLGPLGSCSWITPRGGAHLWSLRSICSGLELELLSAVCGLCDQSQLWGDEGLVPSLTALVSRGTWPGQEACTITTSPLGWGAAQYSVFCCVHHLELDEHFWNEWMLLCLLLALNQSLSLYGPQFPHIYQENWFPLLLKWTLPSLRFWVWSGGWLGRHLDHQCPVEMLCKLHV